MNLQFDIRECQLNQIGRIQKFIHEEWKANHILARDSSLMDWQYGTDNGYNFFVAESHKALIGVLGFIPISRFTGDKTERFFWLALWKVKDMPGVRGAGLLLLKALRQKYKKSDWGVVGINRNHIGLYKSLGCETGLLKHYFITNRKINPSLIKVDKKKRPVASDGTAIFKQGVQSLSEGEEESIFAGYTPRKSCSYLRARFENHPGYDYKIYTIIQDNKAHGFIVARVVKKGTTTVIRIVDFMGDCAILAHCGTAIQQLMEDEAAEYCDFLNHGVKTDPLHSAGFRTVDTDREIVPNFFEPFELANHQVHWAAYLQCRDTNLRIFRADGDQDRPN